MKLFEPLELRSLRIRNRIAMSPMTQRTAGLDGCATDWHLVHYGSRATGGCGLLILEDTAVQEQGRTSSAALGLYCDRQVPSLARIVSFVRGEGAGVGIQLAHAGRKAMSDMRGDEGLLSSCSQPYAPGWRAPAAAGEPELASVVECFAQASARALAADFDLIEIHAGHGFLLHQFLSPLVNGRRDGYGGSLRNRARLLLEVVEAVRGVWPDDRPLLLRLPAGDGPLGGMTIADAAEVAGLCGALGVDLIDISGGSPLFGGEPAGAQDMLELAGALREQDRPAFALGSGIDSGASAQRLLRRSGAALITVGRPLLRNPNWALLAEEELRESEPAAV